MTQINGFSDRVFSIVHSKLNLQPTKPPAYIEGKQLDGLIKNGKNPLVIYISATWCTNCAAFKSDFMKGYKNHQSKVDFYQMDFDKLANQEKIEKYKITGVPALLIFNDQKLLSISIGKMDSKNFHQTLQSVVDGKKIKKNYRSTDFCAPMLFDMKKIENKNNQK